MTTAGKRNRRVLIERYTATTDDYGAEVQTFAAYADTFAEVLFGTGQERREAAQEVGAQPATFIVLSNPKTAAVTVRDRIVFDGANWDITSNVPVGLNRERHITAVRSA